MSSYKKTIVLGMDNSQFNKGMDQSKQKTDEFSKEMDSASESVDEFGDVSEEVSQKLASFAGDLTKAIASGVAFKKIFGAFKDLTLDLAETAEELTKTADATGLTVEKVQALNYAASQLDVEASTITDAMNKTAEVMAKARDGSDELSKVFSKLHITVKDSNGQLKSAEGTFYQIIDALGKVKNETERTALAQQIFGDSAKNLNPLINEGADALKGYMIEAQKLGLIIEGDTVTAASDLQDRLDTLKQKFEVIKMTLGEVLLPVMEVVVGILTKTPAWVGDVIAVLGVAAGIIAAVTAAMNIYKTVATLVTAVNAALGASGMVATSGLTPLLAVLLAIAAAIAIIGGTKLAIDAIADNARSATEKVTSTAGKTKYNASGTQYFEGGETWVGENGPERVILPRGSRIMNNRESQGGVTNIYNVDIRAADVKEFNDIVRLAKNEQTSYRVGKVVM